MEQLLITLNDIIEICDNVSSNLREDKLVNAEILNAQRFDLSTFLGESFYYDFIQNSTDQKYIDLLNGKEFVNCENETVFFYGLRYVLSWRAYAKMLNRAGLHLTRTGSRRKQGQTETEPYDSEKLSQALNNANSRAIFYENNALEFLEKNKIDYPLYKGCKASNTSIDFHVNRKNKTNKRYINDYKNFNGWY